MAFGKGEITKRFSEKIVFLFLVIFPFGQLIRLNFSIFGNIISLHPIDLIAGLALLLFVLSKLKLPKIFKYLSSFLAAATFSLLFSLTIFPPRLVLIGSFYLLRFISYGCFFILVWNITKSKNMKETLFNSLIIVSSLVAIYGLIQYLWLPDLRDLKYLGWDDHYFRLVSTFLDPGFTGILLVFGFLASINKFVDRSKSKISLIALVLFLVTIALTYSRASYLALIGGSLIIFFRKLGKKNIFWIILMFILLIPILPRPGGEGVKLERIYSVYAKLENYKQTVSIIQKYPLFGVGFNNMCQARVKYLKDIGFESHSCSGSDSSLLLVFATTGIVGLLIFLNFSIQVLRAVEKNIYGEVFIASSVALFFHSLFVNSLFYPWVMGWMGILLAISLKNISKKEM